MWSKLLDEFESIAARDDSSLIWTFDASLQPSHTTWSLAAASSGEADRRLWKLFADAGSALERDCPTRPMFPARLLEQSSPEERWFAALRYSGINVQRLSLSPYRTEHGIIRSAAEASAILCEDLAAHQRRDGRQSRMTVPIVVGERDSCGSVA
jgi:hypothetical protein